MSFTPGVVLVLEATDSYLRKTPSVKRLVFKSVSDVSTRLVMLKRGDVDGAYGLSGEIGEEVRRSAGLTLRQTPFTRPFACSSPTSSTRARPGMTGACGSRHEWRDDPSRLGGLEQDGREREMHRPRHLRLGCSASGRESHQHQRKGRRLRGCVGVGPPRHW